MGARLAMSRKEPSEWEAERWPGSHSKSFVLYLEWSGEMLEGLSQGIYV